MKKKRESSGFSTSEIQNHPVLQELNLTEDEIFRNKKEISIALDTWDNCTKHKKFCHLLGNHYYLERNQDNHLILNKFECRKPKRYNSINEYQLNQKISKYLHNTPYLFNASEINKIIQDHKDQPIVLHIGNSTHPLKNTYKLINAGDQLHKIYLFHAIVSGIDFAIIRSIELKDLSQDRFGRNYKIDSDHEMMRANQYQKCLNCKLLIIIDLGMEDNYLRNFYYLDFLPQLLNQRCCQNKSTCIFTTIPWGDIKKEIQSKKNMMNSETIHNAKLNHLNDTINAIFFEDSK